MTTRHYIIALFTGAYITALTSCDDKQSYQVMATIAESPTVTWVDGGSDITPGCYTVAYVRGDMKLDGISRAMVGTNADWWLVNSEMKFVADLPGLDSHYMYETKLDALYYDEANKSVKIEIKHNGGKLGVYFANPNGHHVAGNPSPTWEISKTACKST